jgi:ABC-type polysaccharide/polyol phosphate transport system ATPase subunit
MGTIIRLEQVSKAFRKDNGRAPLIGLVRHALGGTWEPTRQYSLQDLDLAIEQGDKIGLIGSNGAGKTTLLKVIAGLYPPSSGSVEVRGRISFLAGFGTGMLEELTVIENATLYAAIYGVDRNRIEANLDEIVEWAGLREFRHTLFKHLSAGMKVRLAFSTYRYFVADIFLMDEALSAGDLAFRKKSHEVLLDQMDSDRTMVIASHNTEFVEEFCNKTLWLEHGKLRAFGASAEVVDLYNAAAEPVAGAVSELQPPMAGN